MKNIEDMITSLRLCATESPVGEYPCEKCYLYPDSRDGRMPTGLTCFQQLTLDVIEILSTQQIDSCDEIITPPRNVSAIYSGIYLGIVYAPGLEVNVGGILYVKDAGQYALPCDGTAYLPEKYPNLFDTIGYKFGRIENLFRVPDLREY